MHLLEWIHQLPSLETSLARCSWFGVWDDGDAEREEEMVQDGGCAVLFFAAVPATTSLPIERTEPHACCTTPARHSTSCDGQHEA